MKSRHRLEVLGSEDGTPFVRGLRGDDVGELGFEDVGVEFGAFGDGLQTHDFAGLDVASVEFLLDDAEQLFVELEEGFDFPFVLAALVAELLDFVVVLLGRFLQPAVFRHQRFHCNY